MLSRRSRLTCRIPCARLSGRHSPKPAASSTASISRNWPAKPCRSCASSTAGMPYSWLMMKWRKPDKRARSISRTDFPMVTPVRNCLYARVTSCSSPPTNGPTGRSRGPRYCLRNTRTSRRHTDCAIPCPNVFGILLQHAFAVAVLGLFYRCMEKPLQRLHM